jgi:methyl-accepting chemotaxis protein
VGGHVRSHVQRLERRRDITFKTHDEIRNLADGYNLFAVKIREILGTFKQLGLSIAAGFNPKRLIQG